MEVSNNTFSAVIRNYEVEKELAIQTQVDASVMSAGNTSQYSPNIDFSANGEEEQDTIINWINKSGYNDKSNQPLPDWKWWSYA